MQVKEALRLGWLIEGDRLPAVREVVATCGINANTVLKAYRALESEGLVEGRHGTGTFVRATLQAVRPQVMERLREELAKWVGQARADGMAEEDMRALLGAVLVESRTELGD
nr:Transcriptional regulator, GntR family [Kibdelosporangium sp. MJ126-NF4]CTQ90179.1 Transcriptional regulator, GntR family [Kibdelosporangium sp. MJ126-NF4]